MKISVNKILPLIVIMLMVVMVSGCNTNQKTNQTNKYAANGVSFEYPSGWGVATATSPNAVAAVADPKTVTNGIPTTLVVIQKPDSSLGYDLQQAYNQNYARFFNNTGYQKVSEGNITVNNNRAYENTYTIDEDGVQKEFRAVWLTNNGGIYVILCSSLKANFTQEQSNFDLIINSFQAQ
jgi:hypothetical protein